MDDDHVDQCRENVTITSSPRKKAALACECCESRSGEGADARYRTRWPRTTRDAPARFAAVGLIAPGLLNAGGRGAACRGQSPATATPRSAEPREAHYRRHAGEPLLRQLFWRIGVRDGFAVSAGSLRRRRSRVRRRPIVHAPPENRSLRLPQRQSRRWTTKEGHGIPQQGLLREDRPRPLVGRHTPGGQFFPSECWTAPQRE